MFEEPNPFNRIAKSDSPGRSRLRPGVQSPSRALGQRSRYVGAVDEKPATSALALRASEALRTAEAMRALEWHELTARLNAARDLRRELRSEANLCAGSSGASFGDAAERYFRALADGERPVNLDALEGSKGSSGIVSPTDRDAARHVARGVAREQND